MSFAAMGRWACAVLLLLATAGCGRLGAPATHDRSPAPCDSFVFIHAGDPQIGGWTNIADTQSRLIELAAVANAMQPAFVIMVGDLVNDGAHEQQLKALDEALARFHVPTRLMIGNHDDLAAFRSRYGKDFYSFAHCNCEFICLNSNYFDGLAPDAQKRRLAQEQLEWLEATMKQAVKNGKAHIIVAMHHPPALLPLYYVRLKALFDEYGVQVVLAGHIHKTTQDRFGKATVYTVGGTAWVADKPNGYGYRVFRVRHGRIEQEYVRLGAAAATQAAG